MPDLDSEPLFEERQKLGQLWLRLLVLLATAGPILLMVYGLYQQLYLGRPFGTNPVGDTALIIISVLITLLCVAVLLGTFMMELHVRVERDRVVIRFRPLLRKIILMDQIVQARPRTYNPILEYGGWGIRFAWRGKGRAYNAYGNRGVHLDLTTGRHILIGSQRPEALAEAVNCAREMRGS